MPPDAPVVIPPLQPKDFLAPSIAVLALVFTVGSFWWSNWRRGRIQVDRPRTFAYMADASRSLLLIPLAVTNSGARVIVVTALRVKLADTDGQTRTALLLRERQGPAPKSNDGVEIASNFTIEGRKSQIRFAEFEFSPPLKLSDGKQAVRIDGLLAHKCQWRTVGNIELVVDLEKIARNGPHYLAYDNAGSLPE